MKRPRVILASQSPRRIELLRQITFQFEVMPSVVEEVQSEHLTARETAQLNAYRKARAVAKRFPDALVLGADTVVELNNTLFGKPETLGEARTMLLQLQGKTHQVVTGLCLIHLRGHRQKLYAESTEVNFRRLTRLEIDRYLEKVNPLDKAGGYAIQEYGESIVRGISGSYTNVMGLPVESLRTELASWGLST